LIHKLTIDVVDFINDSINDEERDDEVEIPTRLLEGESDSEQDTEAFVNAVKQRSRKSAKGKEIEIEGETDWHDDLPLWDDRKMWIISVKVCVSKI
jgi:hypothetical protein